MMLYITQIFLLQSAFHDLIWPRLSADVHVPYACIHAEVAYMLLTRGLRLLGRKTAPARSTPLPGRQETPQSELDITSIGTTPQSTEPKRAQVTKRSGTRAQSEPLRIRGRRLR